MTVFTAAIGSSDGWVKFHRDQDEQPGDNYYKEGQVGPSLFDLRNNKKRLWADSWVAELTRNETWAEELWRGVESRCRARCPAPRWRITSGARTTCSR